MQKNKCLSGIVCTSFSPMLLLDLYFLFGSMSPSLVCIWSENKFLKEINIANWELNQYLFPLISLLQIKHYWEIAHLRIEYLYDPSFTMLPETILIKPH